MSKLFPRKCSATSKGMNAGACVMDGAYYYSDTPEGYAALIATLRSMGYEGTDAEVEDNAYTDNAYYYTEWEELDTDVNYTEDGEEVLS